MLTGVRPALPLPPRVLRLLALALAGAALLGSGCQSSLGEPGKDVKRDIWGRAEPDPKDGPLPPSFDPIVLPRPGRRPASGTPGDDAADRETCAVEAADEAWQAKASLVRGLIDAGEDEQALALLDAALGSAPPAAWSGRLKELKQELRTRRIEEGLLRVDVRAVKDVSPFAADVAFVVRIRNVSAVEIVFSAASAPGPSSSLGPRPGDSESSPSALSLEVLRRDRDVYASLLERSWTQTVRLQPPGDPPLRLAPGELREFPVTVPAEDAGPAIAGVRVLEVSGLLRPSGLSVGGQPETITLRVRKGRAVVLPQGFEPLAADPLGGMEHALPLGAAAHVLVAAEFVPRDRAPEAVALLARALAEGEPVMVTAAAGALAMLRERCVGDPLAPLVEPLLATLEARPERAPDLVSGLEQLTDVRLAHDGRLWQDWWRRTKDRSPVVTPPAPSNGSGLTALPGAREPAGRARTEASR